MRPRWSMVSRHRTMRGAFLLAPSALEEPKEMSYRHNVREMRRVVTCVRRGTEPAL